MTDDLDMAPGDLSEINYQIARAYQTYPPGFAGPFTPPKARKRVTPAEQDDKYRQAMRRLLDAVKEAQDEYRSQLEEDE